MSKRPGATLGHRRAKVSRRDATGPSNGSKILDLPLELRHHIYADLICLGLPGSRSALTVTNRQLRKEVHDWLAGQKITVHVEAWQNEWRTASPWYEPILRRATNVEFDLSCLPGNPSHPTVDLLCRLWRHECHLKRVTFTVLNDSVPARKCRYDDDSTNLPDTLPSASKELLCGWLMHPLKLFLDKHKIPHAHTPMIWKQPNSRLPRKEHLERHYENSEAVAILSQSFGERVVLQPHEAVWTPLVHAVRRNYEAVVRVLVESATVDILRTTNSGRSLLIEASLAGHPGTMDALLQGLDPRNVAEVLDMQDFEGRTALSHAAKGRQHDIVVYLLKRDADPDRKDHEDMTPLLHAVRGGEIKIVKTLCKNEKVNPLASDAHGRTILHIGAKRGDSQLFKFLLQQRGINVHAVDASGRTALSYAAQYERVAVVKTLLDLHKASVDVTDKSGRTPLSYAAEHNNYKTTDLLLEAGAKCTSEDSFGRTPLFYAVEAGHYATTARLVKHTKNGNSALSLAGQMKKKDIEEKLLREIGKDDANWEDDRLEKLLLQSARDGRDCMVRLLLYSHEVKADVEDIDRRTPLSHAAEKGHLNIVRILSRNKADRNLADKRGHRPVDYARRHGYETHKCIYEDWVSRAEFDKRKVPSPLNNSTKSRI